MTQPVSTDQEVQDQPQPVIERVLCARRYRDKRWYKVKWGDRLGRGQRPRRNSYWARTLEGIEKCPRHRSAATHDPFGRPLACKCGFHKPTPALDPSAHTRACLGNSSNPQVPLREQPRQAATTAAASAAAPEGVLEPTMLSSRQVLSESPATSSAPTPRDAAAPAPTAPARSSREPATASVTTSPPTTGVSVTTLPPTTGVSVTTSPPTTTTASLTTSPPTTTASITIPPTSSLVRRPTDFRQHLPEEWKSTVRVLDQAWIGRALFVSGPAKGKARDVLTTNLANWWHPPRLMHTARPTLAAYFARLLFLWMLRKMWHMRVTSPNCGTDEELRSKGLYRRVRHVIDVTDVYYLAAEYMDCRSC
ncbi:hypothetical protein NP493_1158g00026 [Ridgeia piscesae]|uniref:DUF6729 domain-containing protein n=1 Tax=Ridgeia piscesae TaxID=27915 RepID=A0AAD9KFL6_RIDPI|nr:hypothetical protein NP493_1158g00026 [Ridgeia piscesae]